MIFILENLLVFTVDYQIVKDNKNARVLIFGKHTIVRLCHIAFIFIYVLVSVYVSYIEFNIIILIYILKIKWLVRSIKRFANCTKSTVCVEHSS